MEKAIIIRYSEIHLKGNNRHFFENLLIENIKSTLKDFQFDFQKTYGRYIISNYDENLEESIIDKLKKVFGIHSISPCFVVENDLDKITEAILYKRFFSDCVIIDCSD